MTMANAMSVGNIHFVCVIGLIASIRLLIVLICGSSFVEFLSMVFVIAKAADVVPDGGLVAAIALGHASCSATSGYLRIFLSGDLLRNHVEVHHVVAPWSLVALRAV